MANKRRQRKSLELLTVEMNMTPIIDVVFNLLIFFLCQIKFKILEGKLETYLPTDKGAQTTQLQEMMEEITIRLQVKGDETLIAVNGKVQDRVPVPRPKADGSYDLPEKPILLPNTERVIANLHQKQPDVAAVIEPDQNVPTGHVVAVVDACLNVDHSKINFSMPAPKASR